MAIKNNGALRILTKDKMSIISVDPKDITASGCCVYTFPRTKAFRDTPQFSKIVLGEYEDEIYAKEVIQLIFAALTKEEGTFEMPCEEDLDKYEDALRKKACRGAENIIKANTEYETKTGVDEYGDSYIYTEGKMTVIDNSKEVFLSIRNPGVRQSFDFTVSRDGKHITHTYHTLHELLIDRYGVFLASMHKESEERNKAAENENLAPAKEGGERVACNNKDYKDETPF